MKQRGRKPKCPYCRSARTIRKGVRRTVTLGDRALCFCRDCSRKFTLERKAPGRFLFGLLSPLIQPGTSRDVSDQDSARSGLSEIRAQSSRSDPSRELTPADSDFSNND